MSMATTQMGDVLRKEDVHQKEVVLQKEDDVTDYMQACRERVNSRIQEAIILAHVRRRTRAQEKNA
jgi:hypothetical protein